MKKKGISAIVATVMIILITVSAVTIIWAWVIPMIQNSIEPEFKITTVVCKNETIADIKTSFPSDYNKIECPDFLVENISCYDSHNNKILNAICKGEKSCFNLIGFEDIGIWTEDFGVLIFYPSEKYNESFLNETIEVCEDVEVEEIWIKDWKNFIGDMYSGQYLVQSPEGIAKEDLSIEWLDENCEPYQCSSENYTDCISYKCRDYLVEVIK